MKKLILIVVIMLSVFTSVFAKPADYSGNWLLNKEKSKDLPFFYDNVKSHKLTITQDEKTLDVAVEINDGRPELIKMGFIYNLNGTETTAEAKIHTPNGEISVPTSLKAEPTENGEIKITISREIPMPDGTFKGVTIENWKLSADGKTLTIHRADDNPRGKLEFDMVFVKS
ncbi:MAG TPA: hypothetical protein PKY82_18900 [Pyrinomonadaceae bacterium]|nr:hypothetical protein [Pyrinomonadaceae bacterium]